MLPAEVFLFSVPKFVNIESGKLKLFENVANVWCCETVFIDVDAENGHQSVRPIGNLGDWSETVCSFTIWDPGIFKVYIVNFVQEDESTHRC